MRVIPIEHAISGEIRRASYEEVSKYLNETVKVGSESYYVKKSF